MSADYLNKKIFLLVEGSSDILFLKKFLNEHVDILESFSGKQGVREIIEYFLDDNSDNKVFGICDRDYDYTYQNKHIFYYDYSTLEIMIVHNDNVFNNITTEYYRGDKSFEELRIWILKELSWLSALRKCSFDKNLKDDYSAFNSKSIQKKKQSSEPQKNEAENVIPSEAEKFLNGQGGKIPKSMGMGKEIFSIPPKEFMQAMNKKTNGFSLEEALTPKESLAEIMTAFNLDD